MSVIVTVRGNGDPRRLEEWTAANAAANGAIVERAKAHGLIAHRFYGSLDDSQVLVADEWPDPESFQRFFEEQRAEIEQVFQAAGVTSAPEVTFWRRLETGDAVGWD